MKRYRKPGWIAVGFVVVISIFYFVIRISDESFRDAAIGNLFATIVGILIGVPIAFEINRRQEDQRMKLERDARSRENNEILRSIYERIKDEIIQNRQILKRLRFALDQTETSRKDHWAWMIAIAEGFSDDAYEHLKESRLREDFPFELHLSVEIAYTFLNGLKSRINEADAAHSFHYGYKTDQDSADAELGFVRDIACEADRRVEDCVADLKSYKRYFQRSNPVRSSA